LVFLVSAYTLVVQAVQEFNSRSLIEQLSLFGSNDASRNGTQFYLGETLFVYANVSAGNVYSVTIYGRNASVFSKNGWINGSVAVVGVPLDPPDFRANESYVVTFSSIIPVFPIPGASVTDTRMAAFVVLASSTQLSLTCNYDGASHWLSLSAYLTTSQGAPVANKTITFDLQLNTSSYIQDRGWLLLGSATTDANGLASYLTGCDLFSGIQYVKAEFAGDSDYSACSNTTQFTVAPFSPVIQSVNVTSSAGGIEYAVEVTDPSGYPLMGKTVAVADQNSTDPEYAVTDAEGTALVGVNSSDSSSDPVQNVTVLSDTFTCQSELTCGSSGYVNSSSERVIHLPSSVPRASKSTEGLTVSILPSRPCAVLPTLVTASYRGSINGWAYFSFLLDGVRQLSQVAVLGQGNSTYKVPLEWCSDVVGNHSITVSVSGAVSAEDSVAVDPAPCPDNLQLYTPQVIYGNQLQFSLVFTRPTPYNQTSTALFSSFNTAPTCAWNGTTCKIDEGIIHSSVTLSINAGNTLLYRRTVTTNEDGVASINDSITMTRPDLTCDFVANTSRNSNFAFLNLTRVVNYSDVGVSASGGVNKNLTLSCSVGVGNASGSQVYVGAESPVEAAASLFGMPVYDAPMNVTFAEFIPTCETWNKTGVNYGRTLTIPAGANFLGVACIYTSPCLDADIAPYKLNQSWSARCDGVVNLLDANLIAINWLKTVGKGADPLADINHDGIVNLLDMTCVSLNWLKHGSYLPSFGAVAVFSSGGNSSLDSAGCAVIPKQAQGGTGSVRFTLKNGTSVGAFVAFFCVVNQTSELNIQSLTDTSGEAQFSWTPSEAGDYLVEVKLPARFNATVSQNESTSLSTSVCAVSYVQVVPRPLTLNLTVGQSVYSMNIPACNDTFIWPGTLDGVNTCGNVNFGSWSQLALCTLSDSLIADAGYHGDGPAWIFLNFNLYSLFKGGDIYSATLTMYPTFSWAGLDGEAERAYGVYAVIGPWSQESLCWNNADTNDYLSGTPLATQTVELNSPSNSQSISNVTWDLTSAFNRLYELGSAAYVYGFMIRDMNPNTNDPTEIDFNSTNAGMNPPTLHIEFEAASNVELEAYDPVLARPASESIAGSGEVGLLVDWTLNGTDQGQVLTDPTTGYAGLLFGNPLTGLVGIYNVTASYPGDDEYQLANITWVYDYRWSSNITCQQGTAVNATVNQQRNLCFQLFSQELDGINLVGMPVNFYVDGVAQGSNSTVANGQVSFSSWYPRAAKTYVITARFGGTRVFGPCNVSVCVTAQVVPVGVGFSVSRSEFAPGTTLTLTANLTNLRKGGVMPNFLVQFCYNTSAGKSGVLYTGNTTENGVATHQWSYPNNGTAYAIYAQAGTTLGNQPQNMASSPVQLTVGCNTTLLLSVSRQNSSDTHMFMARLVDSNGKAVAGRIVTLELNDTAHEYNQTTDQYGNATWTETLSPQANDSATVYNVAVSFAGDLPAKTAIASLKTPNGTSYTVCSTLQYGTYKPSANSTSILVWPQTTTGTTTLESPDQLQADAKSKGYLSVYNEFSWRYPWYRMHVKISFGGAIIDVGFNPLLPFGDVVKTENLGVLLAPIPRLDIDPELASQIAQETILGTLVEGLALASAVVVTANTHITPASLIALGVYGLGVSTIFAYAYSLYCSGDQLRALSVLTGTSINMLGVGLAAFLGCASLVVASHIVDWIAFPILGAVLTNMLDPSLLVTALTSAILILFISIAVGLLAFHFVPDPTSAWFLPAFISLNFSLVIFASELYAMWV
jgi:hypothetical protein